MENITNKVLFDLRLRMSAKIEENIVGWSYGLYDTVRNDVGGGVIREKFENIALFRKSSISSIIGAKLTLVFDKLNPDTARHQYLFVMGYEGGCVSVGTRGSFMKK